MPCWASDSSAGGDESAPIATMICEPGRPVLTVISEEELEAREHLRVTNQPGVRSS
ncbi:hypothetical protein GCM10022267_91600 [Lentzea roselyniae]|uniref:Uncharacterized protein n=1 Tax=Lentzea roselyniae TaxID=531940 RepID=A0ABP7CLA8_9PSEU